jgi:hypothetical protein
MYRTIQSPASVKADATVGEETGLRLSTLDPVLACPVALWAAAPFVGLASAAVGAAVCPNFSSSGNNNTAAMPPSRLSVNSAPVSSSASVDELISAVRRDHTSA